MTTTAISRRYCAGLALLAFVLALVSCGGGGGGSGDEPFASTGKGAPPFSSDGAGNPPFGEGSGGGGTIGDGPRPNPDPTVTISDDAIQGSVLNAGTGGALANATVRFDGVTLSTNAQGDFTRASHAPNPRLILRGEATGFETMVRVTPLIAAVPSYTLFKLAEHGLSASLEAANGGTVESEEATTRIVVPAGALQEAGAAATGEVTVRVTALAMGSDTYLASGDYTDSSGTSLEAFGGVVLTNNRDLTVASGASLDVRVPVSTRSSNPPASVTAYYLDPATARWVAGPSATLAGGDAPYYSFQADRFGQWMVGAPLSGGVVVTGCVQDENGNPAANVTVTAEGISYTGLAVDVTDTGGNFTLPVRSSGTVIVSGRRGALLTNSATATTSGGSTNLSPCLTLPTVNAATVRLTWGEAPRDLDSHLRLPGGVHVYYVDRGSLGQAPYANLDVDDVTGFGPEVTTIRRPRVGIYRFYVHNFSGTFAPGMTQSPARVELNYAGRTVVFTPPASEGSARYWHVFDLEIGDNCSMTLYRYSRWRLDEPQNPNSDATPAECQP